MPIEVLAPAGDHDALAAALGAGADAVYFGLDEGFNARARASNFALADLPAVVALIHRAGARAYVTFNTLVFEPELVVVEQLVRAAAAAGVDALIVQDPAVALIARALCPDLEVHASTQMTISSPAATRLAAALGVTRIVAPRELSVEQIGELAAASPVPLEVFIHGALCVSWSGQCLTSESWGQRSANRGQCAQSCRLPYDLIVDGQRRDLGEVKYLLSPKDLVGLDAVPRLAELGVASLKIEGRQKAALYVAEAVGAYRAAVDAGAADEGARARLAVAFSRGGSPGFLGGIDHQHLVEGRFPRHRGLALGFVRGLDGRGVTVEAGPGLRPVTGGLALAGDGSAAEAAAAPRDHEPTMAPRPGMGVAFDQGRPEDEETGGPIFTVDELGPGRWRLGFGVPGPDLGRVTVGDRVWITSDPAQVRAAQRVLERGGGPLGRIGLDLTVRGAAGAPLEVVARGQGRHGAVQARATSASALAPARGAGLDAALLADKLGALGGTPFHLGAVDGAGLASGLHLPVSELKEVRRQLVVGLEAALAAPSAARQLLAGDAVGRVRAELAGGVAAGRAEAPPELVVLCRTDAQLDAALAAGCAEVELDWMELVGLGRAVARARAAGARVVVATPRIQKPGEDKIDAFLLGLVPDGVLVRSWGALATFAALPAAERPALHGDFSLNVTNSLSARWVAAQGLTTITCAHDLDAAQLEALLAAAGDLPLAVTIHHHIPTFHTEHCVYAHLLSHGRDHRSCGRPCEQHEVSLADRVGLVHPVVVDVGCRNTVFNAQAQSAAGLVPRLLAAGVRRLRIELVRENAAETTELIGAYRELVAGRASAAATVARVRVHEQFGVTRGTFRTLTVLR